MKRMSSKNQRLQNKHRSVPHLSPSVNPSSLTDGRWQDGDHRDDVVDTVQDAQPQQDQEQAQPEEVAVTNTVLTYQPPPGSSLPPEPSSIGPSLPPEDESQAYPEEMDQDDIEREDSTQPPSSPYTANRALIHNLTLPTVPNLDIPPSPPASPSSAIAHAALTARIDKFLELKRKKSTHFNAKIADSHALKNPPLMDKLLGFAGIGVAFDEASVVATEQYTTTLPTDLWDPSSFPEWAYRAQLRKSQERVLKEKGREKGEAVQFVPASS